MDDIKCDINCTPPELREIAEGIDDNLIPGKSRELYEKKYEHFDAWCTQNNVKILSENTLLAYFHIQSKTKKSSTLWAMYSMLRSCLNIYKNVDISKYSKLQAFLKRSSVGYEPKQSKILEVEEINEFIEKADNTMYLAIKVVLIIGCAGACRREELINITIKDLEYKSDVIVVTIPKTKNNISRVFTITTSEWINLIKKYADLRPKNITHQRFFLTYRNGYCISAPIGINTIGKLPKVIATFLKLPNPELYSGHCFRRSGVSHLGNIGSDLITIRHHGGQKLSADIQGYIDTSVKKKIKLAQIFLP